MQIVLTLRIWECSRGGLGMRGLSGFNNASPTKPIILLRVFVWIGIEKLNRTTNQNRNSLSFLAQGFRAAAGKSEIQTSM
jgi:hypothetical protein